ncbi:hypothetical protein NDU88_000024 [Pleurodeles waltl]|uniref:Uncharacterized protein n=1 Tax=Pleurodeles waltl TaxID=8319 RepID=A0AAV7LW80_PLEWA|nr:hypothetical protein NDU88_000024 [Pleurodeles waltl]
MYTGPTPVVHRSYTCRTPVLHLSYTGPTPVVHRSYTCRTPVLHLSYTGPTPVVHRSYTCRTPVLHLSYTGPTPVVHRSYTCCTPVLHLLYTGPTPAVHRSYTCRTPVLHLSYTGPTPDVHRSYTGGVTLLANAISSWFEACALRRLHELISSQEQLVMEMVIIIPGLVQQMMKRILFGAAPPLSITRSGISKGDPCAVGWRPGVAQGTLEGCGMPSRRLPAAVTVKPWGPCLAWIFGLNTEHPPVRTRTAIPTSLIWNRWWFVLVDSRVLLPARV